MSLNHTSDYSGSLYRSVSLILTISSYVISTYLLFGSIWWPFGFLFQWSDRLGWQYWSGPIVAGLVIGGAAAFKLRSKPGGWIVAPSAFCVVSMTITVAMTTLVVGQIRDRAIAQFNPDKFVSQSLWRSLREAPREFQFYLHAAAVKDCKPYAWSYRQMKFYELPPNVAKNVLPKILYDVCLKLPR